MSDNGNERRAFVIAAMSNKGGPGKTSSTTNTAVALAQMGKRVLVIDADQQANATEVLTHGKKFYAQFGPTICDLYNNQKFDVRDVIIPAKNGEDDIPDLFLIPSDPSFERVMENSMARPHREKILLRHLKPVISEFDFILIDCSPALNLSSTNAAYVADHVIIPIDGGSFSLTGAETVLDYLDEIKEEQFSHYSLFRNEFNSSKKKMNTFLQDELEGNERFKSNVLETRIRADENIAQAQVVCKPLYFYKRGALVLNDYRAMAKEIISIKEGAH
ncbi:MULTISPECIES: ParA family protein [Pantoea]|jgi:chromosome partitioning protein|uniref:ParA family protein n=1 Tax=Pantoea brenneri TaxID=472694 RepID=A0A7Y6NJ18_9GAMM|nr:MULTISPECIES: ParA family protein [Pantoea]MBZ6398039.1 ParA family protein [Pantoea sp.]MBZ6441142.1 ParA family protein [Pantoea sp.]MDH1089059.1 ParA family protein [Pantoea brenneri]MDU7865775.1 ParA family protein [Pantoea sp.]NUY44524.1 ParA family protein [Pantoea brenneri]